MAKIDWYERRDELRPNMIFRCQEGTVVRLDRQVPGDGTKWYVDDWNDQSNRWSCMDSTIEPSDLAERLPDNYSGSSAS